MEFDYSKRRIPLEYDLKHLPQEQILKILTGEEYWKIIPGTDDKYLVSTHGRVYRLEHTIQHKKLKRHFKKGFVAQHDSKGYWAVSCPPIKSSIKVHRLMALAFFNVKTSRYINVDHIQEGAEGRRNNHIFNLQIVPTWWNITKARELNNRRGTSKYPGVSKGTGRQKHQWRARIGIQGKQVHLGWFSSEQLAYQAYLKAYLKYRT